MSTPIIHSVSLCFVAAVKVLARFVLLSYALLGDWVRIMSIANGSGPSQHGLEKLLIILLRSTRKPVT